MPHDRTGVSLCSAASRGIRAVEHLLEGAGRVAFSVHLLALDLPALPSLSAFPTGALANDPPLPMGQPHS